jgi:hypothetical protein
MQIGALVFSAIFAIAILLVFTITTIIIRARLRAKGEIAHAFSLQLLQIKLPRAIKTENDKVGVAELREKIALMEQVYSQLGTIKEKGFHAWLYGDVPESMGPAFEQYFRNATQLVMEDPASGSTLLDISRVLSNSEFRNQKLARSNNPVVNQFWEEIATKAEGEASLANIVPYITNKFDEFAANDFMRPIIGQQNSSFKFRDIIDNKKILLVNLSKGRLGERSANLLGLIIVGKLFMAALSRADTPRGDFPPFYLYIDEFQNITTSSIPGILSEARKYKLSLTIAHQFLKQVDEKIRDAVFGNVGSMAVFRVGEEDGEFFAKQFAPVFTALDFVNIENRNAYVRLLSKGVPQKPFNFKTLELSKGNPAQIDDLRELSYLTYGRDRAQVEAHIRERYLS